MDDNNNSILLGASEDGSDENGEVDNFDLLDDALIQDIEQDDSQR